MIIRKEDQPEMFEVKTIKQCQLCWHVATIVKLVHIKDNQFGTLYLCNDHPDSLERGK